MNTRGTRAARLLRIGYYASAAWWTVVGLGLLCACEPVTYDFAAAAGIDLLQSPYLEQMVFVRASEATQFDDSGDLLVTPIDEPRFDFEPGTGRPLGLLLESAATNLWLNNRFQAGTIDPHFRFGNEDDAFLVVDGGLLGSGDYHLQLRRIQPGSTYEGFSQQFDGMAISQTYALSFVARRGPGGCPVSVESQLGTVTPEEIQPAPEARRYTMLLETTRAAGSIDFMCKSGQAGDGWDISHIQLELGSVASSVIINDSTTVPAVRDADQAWFNAQPWAGREEGTLLTEVRFLTARADSPVAELSGTSEQSVGLWLTGDAPGPSLTALARAAGATETAVHSPARVGVVTSTSFSYGASELRLAVDGATVSADIKGIDLRGLDRLTLGASRHTEDERSAMWLSELIYWPEQFSAEQLREQTRN